MPAAGILQAAFPGAALVRRPGATLRVLVADLAPQVIVGGQTPLALSDEGRPGPVRARCSRATATASSASGAAGGCATWTRPARRSA